MVKHHLSNTNTTKEIKDLIEELKKLIYDKIKINSSKYDVKFSEQTKFIDE